MSKNKFKLNYKEMGRWLKSSPQVEKVLEKAGKKAARDVKKASNQAESKMKALIPGYEVVRPKVVEYEKGEVTDRQTGKVILQNTTPADYVYNPFVK